MNVFEATRKSVSAGFTARSVSARCVGSTFETKWHLIERFEYGVRATDAIAGPRSLPPMPMLTTCRILLPVNPRHFPVRTLIENSSILSRVLRTSGITSLPSTKTCASGSTLRKAVCSTARFSVAFILSPVNILSISTARPAARAIAMRWPITCLSTRFFE